MVKKKHLLVLCALAAAFALVVPHVAFAAEKPAPSLALAASVNAGKAASTPAEFKDGAYYLRNASSTAVSLAAPASGEGVQVASAKAATGDTQKFYLRNEGGETVSFQSVASGLFLGEKDGQVVELADSKETSMRWKLSYEISKNALTITNVASGAVLSLQGGKVATGVEATAESDAGGASQRWKLDAAKLVANGYYEVVSDYGTYLNIKGNSYAYGARVRANAHKTSGVQTFHIYERKSSGYYYIVNQKSGLVLDVKGGSKKNKANIIQSKKSTKARVLWKPVLDRSGKLVFKNKKSGKALAAASGKKGANVYQRTVSAGARGQLWTLQKTSKRFSLSGNAKLDKYVANVLHSKKSLRAAFNWTVGHGYRNGARYWSNPRVLSDKKTKSLAKDFFKHKSGNCYRFAAAFSWLARGLGYKTKVISGWVQAAGGGQAPHGWVEVRKGGRTYVCDPDLAHEIPGYNWYMTTYATSPTAYHNW